MALVITNSLLRLDGITGEPPSPFARPNPRLNFFVLELGQHANVSSWWAHTAKTLSSHTEFLRQLRAESVDLTLFVESAASAPVLRLDAAFLGSLAAAGISLECSHEIT